MDDLHVNTESTEATIYSMYSTLGCCEFRLIVNSLLLSIFTSKFLTFMILFSVALEDYESLQESLEYLEVRSNHYLV